MDQSTDSRMTIRDGMVVSLDYVLKVDGGIVDKTEQNEPIQFVQGGGQIIPGLERQLYGMSVGESKKVVVDPGDGYGQADDEAYADVPRNEFPPHIPLETGVGLQLRNEDGEVVDAYITEIRPDTVRLDFNHPLAGKELHFTVTVVDLRQATEEELSHGHVHAEGGEYDEYDEEEEDFEFELGLDEEDEEDWEEYDEDENLK